MWLSLEERREAFGEVALVQVLRAILQRPEPQRPSRLGGPSAAWAAWGSWGMMRAFECGMV